MARVAIINDHPQYLEMTAAPLRMGGHEVLTEVAPIDWERILNFGPDVVAFSLYRKPQAFDRPIHGTEDILGWEALEQAEHYPAIQILPILLLADGLEEKDVPTSINYDGFLVFPRDFDRYVPLVEELASKVKTRRKISGYACPCCGSRLVFLKRPALDLFCPRCHTSVAIVDDHSIVYTPRGKEETTTGTLAQLAPPKIKP